MTKLKHTSLIRYLGSIVPQVSWTIVDIFFAITAASLPVLNTLLPQNLLLSTNSDFSHIHKPPESTKLQGPEVNNPGYGPDQTTLKNLSSDDGSRDLFQAIEKKHAPSKQYREDWEDPAAFVQHPQPTHRDKLHSRSVHEPRT